MGATRSLGPEPGPAGPPPFPTPSPRGQTKRMKDRVGSILCSKRDNLGWSGRVSDDEPPYFESENNDPGAN